MKGNKDLVHDFGLPNIKTYRVVNMAKEEAKNKPVARHRIGTVQISEWENEGKEDTKFKSYSLGISYYDKKEKEFKDTKSMSRNQLINLRVIIDSILAKEVSND